jgi:membrane dipeptidase
MRRCDLAHQDFVVVADGVRDIERAHAEGRIALVPTFEAATPIENEVDRVDVLYGFGVRSMGIVYSEANALGCGLRESQDGGLTDLGRAVVRRMNKLGMLIDLAHVAPKVMHDALDVSSAPLVWSHSNAFTLCDHPRNVPDDVLDRVAGNGGVVMATFVPDFISQASRDWHRPAKDQYGKSPEGVDHDKVEAEIAAKSGPRPKATLPEYCDHVDYLAKRIGHDHVGIGSDFFGWINPDGLEDTTTFPSVIAELIRRGWSEENLTKLASGNMLRVLRAVEQAAA